MLRAFLTIGALQGLVMVISLARTKGLAKLLGPEDYGIMGVIDPILIMVSTLAMCSLNLGAVRFLPPLWRDDREQFAALFRAMRNLIVVMVVLASIGGFLVAWLRPDVFPDKLQGHAHALPLAFLCVPVIAFLPFLKNAIAARMQHNRSMLFFMLHAIVFTVAALVGCWWGGLAGYYTLYAIGGTLLMIVVLAWYQREPRLPKVALSGPKFLGLPPLVWRLCGAYIVIHAFMAYSDVMVRVETLETIDRRTAGWLVCLLGLSLAVREVVGAANQVFLAPNVNKEDVFADRIHWALRYQQVLCLMAGVLTAPLLLFPDLIIQLLYSEEFVPGAPFLCLFVVAEILLLISQVLGTLIVSGDHYPFQVVHTSLGYLCRIVLAVVLVRSHGLLGAAWAQLSTPIVIIVLAVTFLVWRHRLRVPLRNTLLILYTVGGMLFLGWIGATRTGFDAPTLLSKLGAAVALALGLYLLLEPQDRRLLHERFAVLLRSNDRG